MMEKFQSQELPIVDPKDIEDVPLAWEIAQEQGSRLVGMYDPFDPYDCEQYFVARRTLNDLSYSISTEVVQDGEGYVAVGLFVGVKKQ